MSDASTISTPLHGPGGLLGTPGMGMPRKRRKWGMRTKDYTAHAGETISGNLGRAQNGKFTRVGTPNADAPPSFGKGAPKKPKKGRKGRTGASAKPKQTPEQHAQAAAQKRQQNAADVAKRMADSDTGLSPSGSQALLAFAGGTKPDPQIAAGLAQMGLAEQASDGSYRMTPTGHAAVAAMQSGDYQRAVDAISRGTDASGKRTQRAQERATRQQAAATKRQQAQARREAVAARRAAKKPAKGHTARAASGDNIASAMQGIGQQASAKPKAPAKSGRTKKDAPATADGKKPAPLKLPPKRQRIAPPSVGGVAGAAGNQKPSKPAKAPAKQIAPALQEAVQQISSGGSAPTPEALQALVTNGLARIDKNGLPILTAAGQRASMKAHATARWNGHAWVKDGGVVAEPDQSQFAGHTMDDWDDTKPDSFYKAKSFLVYKDHAGQPRWIARTTTAYRDRDGEIISEAALDADSQRMMASKQFGPLRYWHIGQPDPQSQDAPWGPGVDIGTCDYSVVIGRTRIESGTFHSASIARKMGAVADDHEMSPGFLYTPDQPDADGVFTSIRTFERSPVPRRYARAANLFTGFTVKEQHMELAEMERRFKAMYQELNLTPEQGVELGQNLIATEKAAQAQGVAFKDSGAPEEITINGVVYAVKAASPPMQMPPMNDPPPEVETKAPGDMAAPEELDDGMDDEGAETGDYLGDMSVSDFESMLSSALAPLIKALDISGKMGAHVEELKSMMGGVSTKSEGTQAEIAALKARLLQIEGDQPAVILPDEISAALKSAGPASTDPEAPEVPNDPSRPLAALAARTMPALYRTGPAGEFAGWTPPPNV